MTRYVGSIKILEPGNNVRAVILITNHITKSGARQNFKNIVKDLYPNVEIMKMNIHKAIKRR